MAKNYFNVFPHGLVTFQKVTNLSGMLAHKKVVTTTAKNEQNLHTTDDDNGRIGTVQFHGPYQPNYGTQFNIEQLNVIVDPLKVYFNYA